MAGVVVLPVQRPVRAALSQPHLPRAHVVGGEHLLCAPAGRKHKEKFSQAPDMSMVHTSSG